MHVSWARNMTASLVSAGIRHCIRLLGRVIMCASSRGLPIGGNPKGKRPSYPVELVPETRTSSPVRIAPDPTSRMHSRHPGLFPCGKTLPLGPRISGQISAHDIDHPGLKKLVDAGAIEILAEDSGSTGAEGGGTHGRGPTPAHTAGRGGRRSGDR